MIPEQELPVLLGWWLSLKVTLTKAICFLYKLNFFVSSLFGVIFHTKPLSVLVWSAPGEGPASRASSECATTQHCPARGFKGFCGEILQIHPVG